MKNSQRIEREFGVAVPGKVLEPARWTQTALKKLPAPGPLDRVALFGRSAPLVVDLGCGNGRFLIASALRRPEFDHIGIDILPMALRYGTRRGNQRGLANLRFAAIDAQRFLALYLAPSSVREIHCYHPQPHHDFAERGKRLLTAGFLASVHSVLEPEGSFFVQTDNEPYWRYLEAVLPAFFDFRAQPGAWPEAPQGRTRREILARSRGYPIYRGWGMKKELGADEIAGLVKNLPPPDFDAGPRHRELDRLERE